MRAVFEILIPVLLWITVIWRAPSVWGPPVSRSLWCFVASVAASLTMRPAAVARVLEALSGVPDITLILKHLTGLAATLFLLDYVYAVHGRKTPNAGRRLLGVPLRYVLTATAAVALTVLFVFFLPHDSRGSSGIDAHYGNTAVRLYLYIFYAFLGTSTAVAGKLFWSNRHNVPGGLLRSGVRLLAAAAATGFVYTLYRIVFVTARGDSRTNTGAPKAIYDPICELLPALALILCFLGLVLPPSRTVFRYLRHQFEMWQLYPLWSDLVSAVPHVVFGDPVSRTRDLFTLGDRTLDIAHRAFEIRDAALALRDDTPAAPGAEPPADGAAAPGAGAARIEADWLHRSVGQRAAGRPAPALPAALTRFGGGRTPREEIAWYLEVAAAYRALGRRRTVPQAG